MQTFKDIKIHNVVKRKTQDIFLTLHIKKEDITREQEDYLYDSCDNSDIFVLALQKADYENTEQEIKNKRNKDLVYLNVLMNKYAEQEGTNLKQEKETLYENMKVTSRTQLSNKQLKELIESYKFGLFNN